MPIGRARKCWREQCIQTCKTQKILLYLETTGTQVQVREAEEEANTSGGARW